MSITVEQHGPVYVIHLGDGDNRFNNETVTTINAALDDIEAGSGPAALVTTGSGKIYSNGLDLEWIGTNQIDLAEFVEDIHALLYRVLRLDVVTVAALNGHAFAAGAMFAAAHDFSIMRDDRGYWCLPEIDIGMPLTDQMYDVLAQRIPKPALSAAILTGRRFTAHEALAAGIVTATAPEADVLPMALDLATANATKDRAIIRTHKNHLHGS